LLSSHNRGRLICFGDLCIDIVARTPALETIESDTTIEQLSIRVAGSAANCAIAAAAAGAQVDVIGLVGNDAFGGMIVEKLNAAGVGTTLIRHSERQTGVVISQVRPNGERALLSYRGANAQPYGALPEPLGTMADYVYLSGYSLQNEASAQTALALKSLAKRCLFDPTYLFARDFQVHHKQHLSGVHILTPNLEEAQLMTGRTAFADCAAALRDLGIATVIVKLGPQGCYLHDSHCQQWIRTSPVTDRADTTGAGDAFCGTLLAQCLQEVAMPKAAERANEAARRIVCS
jgi:sugar/nucleoside kinase (ribokinase family)